MSVVRTPIVSVDGVPLSADVVAYPLTIAAGRSTITQQPDPGSCTFSLPFQAGAAVPVRGAFVTVDLPVTEQRLFSGYVTDVRGRHEAWQPADENVFDVSCAGWATAYAATDLGTTYRLRLGTEQEQAEQLIDLFDDNGRDVTTVPITLDGLNDAEDLFPVPVEPTSLLLPTLQDLSSRQGSIVWEHPADGIVVTGRAVRAAVAETVGTIPAALVALPVSWDAAPVVNAVTVTYSGTDEAAENGQDTPTAYFNWQDTTGDAIAQYAYYDAATKTVSFNREDYFNSEAGQTWLNDALPGSLIIFKNYDDGNALSAAVISDYPDWTDPDVVNVPLYFLDDWAARPGGLGPPDFVGARLATTVLHRRGEVTDAGSIAVFGRQPATVDAQMVAAAGAGFRADTVLDQWSEQRWVATVDVLTDLADDTAAWDDVLALLNPATPVIVDGIYAAAGNIGSAADGFWIEGVEHEFDRTPGGRLTHRATVVLSPLDLTPTGTYPSSTLYPSATLYPGAP